MKITITINTDNDAFGDGDELQRTEEVCRIVREFASGDDYANCKLRDYNGNVVGRVVVEEGDGDIFAHTDAIRDHPDYIGGTTFVVGDLPQWLQRDIKAGTVTAEDDSALCALKRQLEDASDGNDAIAVLFPITDEDDECQDCDEYGDESCPTCGGTGVKP